LTIDELLGLKKPGMENFKAETVMGIVKVAEGSWDTESESLESLEADWYGLLQLDQDCTLQQITKFTIVDTWLDSP
jgi:hypothetical protein